jgi:5'(3')-deoxyribonucleotidase
LSLTKLQEAVENYAELSEWFNTHILSTAPWENQTAWSDKHNWVKAYLGALLINA